VEIVSRGEWGAKPPESVTKWRPDRLVGGVLHWFGSPNGPTDHAKCDDVMRSVQAAHQNGEFNDIAYNHVICLHGQVFEGRGFDAQTGANGTSDANRERWAVAVMMGTGNAASVFTPVVQAALRGLHAEWAARGAGTDVKPHGYFTGSTCPGPTIRAWLDSKPFASNPQPNDPLDTRLYPWLGAWLRWIAVDRLDPAKRPASVPDFSGLTAAQRDELWELAEHVNRTVTFAGPRDPFFDWNEWKRQGSDPDTRPGPPVPATIPQPWWDGRKRLVAAYEDG
jgi:hypothetical protein